MGLEFHEVLGKHGGVDSHGAHADLSAHIVLGQDQIVPQESRRATIRREIFSLGTQTSKPDVKTISNKFVNRTCRTNSSYYHSNYKLGKEAGVDLRGGGGDASYDGGDERGIEEEIDGFPGLQTIAAHGEGPVALFDFAVPVQPFDLELHKGDRVGAVVLQLATTVQVVLILVGADLVKGEVFRVIDINQPILGLSMDPASLIASDIDPDIQVQQLGDYLTVGRLSDYRKDTNLRCAVGQGSLDLMSYRLMLDMAKGRRGPVVLDLRGLEYPQQAAAQAIQAWDNASVCG